MNYTIRKNARFGTTRINCQDVETANVFLAAPMLYEALKTLEENYKTFGFGRGFLTHLHLAKEALAKADGK